MLCPVGPLCPHEWQPYSLCPRRYFQTSSSVVLPSESFFIHFILSLSLLGQAGSVAAVIMLKNLFNLVSMWVHTIKQECPPHIFLGYPHLHSWIDLRIKKAVRLPEPLVYLWFYGYFESYSGLCFSLSFGSQNVPRHNCSLSCLCLPSSLRTLWGYWLCHKVFCT